MITKRQKNLLLDLVRAKHQRTFSQFFEVLSEDPSGFFEAAKNLIGDPQFNTPKERCGTLRVLWFLRGIDRSNSLTDALAQVAMDEDFESRSFAARLAALLLGHERSSLSEGTVGKLSDVLAHVIQRGIDDGTLVLIKRLGV